MVHFTREAPGTLKNDSKNIITEQVQIIQHNGFLSFLLINRNIQVFPRHSDARNNYKTGVIRRNKHLLRMTGKEYMNYHNAGMIVIQNKTI